MQSALDWTNAHGGTTYEIWVAEGVYYPDEGSSHINNAVTEMFRLNWNTVQFYGDFVATEMLRSQRDWVAHPTVLSGDIDHNGTLTGNAYHHVLHLDGVTNQPITGTTVIDGFTITAGNATGGGEDENGGGLYCAGSGSGHGCSSTLTNVTFSGNAANNNGGGVYNNGANGGVRRPSLINCILWGNTATGGPQIYSVSAVPAITYSDVQWPSGVHADMGNLNVNSQFVMPITATVAPTITGNYRLRLTSPVIDAGNNLSITVATDLDGNPRRVDIAAVADTGSGTPPIVDIGPYEMQAYVVYLPVVPR